MSLKERFVDAYLFDADDAFARHEFNDSIHEQKRIPMRQELFDSFRVKNRFHWCG